MLLLEVLILAELDEMLAHYASVLVKLTVAGRPVVLACFFSWPVVVVDECGCACACMSRVISRVLGVTVLIAHILSGSYKYALSCLLIVLTTVRVMYT